MEPLIPDVLDLAPLPALEGGDRLTALVVGPGALFVDWHVDPRSLVRLKGSLEADADGAHMALRVHLIDPEQTGVPRARQVLDQRVDALSGHQHLTFTAHDRPVLAVVSVGLDDGHAFGHLVRSAPVMLPPCISQEPHETTPTKASTEESTEEIIDWASMALVQEIP
ncbi:MAG: hypothetical protein ACE366_21990 [Bradymonadia bacterium]